MYEKTYLEANQAKAGRQWWRGHDHSSLRTEQPGLSQSIRQSYQAFVRHRDAIQHQQQRGTSRNLALHERKARLDICGPARKSQARAFRLPSHCGNSQRASTKQGKLVRLNMVGIRSNNRFGGQHASLASGSLCKMAAIRTNGESTAPGRGQEINVLRPHGGQITPFIGPYHGQIGFSIGPPHGPIRGVFHTFLRPPHGHLLVIPLYSRFIGMLCID